MTRTYTKKELNNMEYNALHDLGREVWGEVYERRLDGTIDSPEGRRLMREWRKISEAVALTVLIF